MHMSYIEATRHPLIAVRQGETIMKEHLFNRYGVKQLRFYVKSIEESAQAFADTFGAGPFFDLGSEPSKWMKYRGQDSTLTMRCDLGQLADMQIELIELDTDEPNVYDDTGRCGLHHLCIWTDDYDKTVEEFLAEGFEEAMKLESIDGRRASYFDCRDVFGIFIKVNAPSADLWNAVKAKADSWDGERALLSMSDLLS